MLANQGLLIETMQAQHQHLDEVLGLLGQTLQAQLGQRGASDVAAEVEQMRGVLRDTDSRFTTLRDASTADLSQVLGDVKKYAGDVVAAESRQLQELVKKRFETSEADASERLKKLESRVLSELASGGAEPGEPGSGSGGLRSGRAGDSQLMKKVANRLNDFESQVTAQMQTLSQDVERKLSFLGTHRGGADERPIGGVGGSETFTQELDALKYDISEIKDLMASVKGEGAHVKRVVLACERDMEDFTAAMDAVNVDLDEMRARVDSTHSIITSRQRVEATVTAEISTIRLDMGDMQEALKAHDAWMEDVSQSLQEAHERCHQLSEDLGEQREQVQAKLDTKTDVVAWNDVNDEVDASVKTVRDMASALRLELDSRRRSVDEVLRELRAELRQLDGKVDANSENIGRHMADSATVINRRIDEETNHSRALEDVTNLHSRIHQEIHGKVDSTTTMLEARLGQLEAQLRQQDEEMHRAINERVDGVERQGANVNKETSKRLNAMDLRISGLQGATGEQKRDLGRLRDEVNSLTVKSAAHDVDVSKSSDDIRKLERQRAEDTQRHKQDMDAVYEELDQKVYEKTFQRLEDNVTKLTRGTVKLCQVVGVFPGARTNDGTDEELDVDVGLLDWQDCAQNLTGRVEKTWRQVSSQKYKSILDLVGKKADHSVLRLLQISQQHIESQLDRVRHERELWKEVVDKRAQQPLQLALTLKDPHTGQPLAGPAIPPQAFGGAAGMIQPIHPGAFGGVPALPRPDGRPDSARGFPTGPAPVGAALVGPPAESPRDPMKATPLVNRITRAKSSGPPPKQ